MMTVRKVQEGTGHPAEGATHILAPRNRGWPLSTREPWVATFDPGTVGGHFRPSAFWHQRKAGDPFRSRAPDVPAGCPSRGRPVLPLSHRYPRQERGQQGGQRTGRQLRVLRTPRLGAGANERLGQVGELSQSAGSTQYLHGCWPMSRMLHAWITFKPRASARASSSGDSEPGLSQTSAAGFRATASISLRPILGET
jgi:hypothetical protein